MNGWHEMSISLCRYLWRYFFVNNLWISILREESATNSRHVRVLVFFFPVLPHILPPLSLQELNDMFPCALVEILSASTLHHMGGASTAYFVMHTIKFLCLLCPHSTWFYHFLITYWKCIRAAHAAQSFAFGCMEIVLRCSSMFLTILRYFLQSVMLAKSTKNLTEENFRKCNRRSL